MLFSSCDVIFVFIVKLVFGYLGEKPFGLLFRQISRAGAKSLTKVLTNFCFSILFKDKCLFPFSGLSTLFHNWHLVWGLIYQILK